MKALSHWIIVRWKSAILLALLAGFVILYGAYWQITRGTGNRIYSDIESLPNTEFALLLGAPKHLKNGSPNRFYKYRLEATQKLYQAGKIKSVIVSDTFPEILHQDLITLGIPSSALIHDPKGISTLESIRSYHEQYPKNEKPVLVISQRDHLCRAIYFANHYHIEAIGYPAKDVPTRYALKNMVRESLARVKALLSLHVWHP